MGRRLRVRGIRRESHSQCGGERSVSESALDRSTLAASQEEDLRALADRLLETRRVEYVDEGVLLIMNPPAFEHREIVRRVDGVRGGLSMGSS